MREVTDLILATLDPNAPPLTGPEREALNQALRDDPAAGDLLADIAYHGCVLREALGANQPAADHAPEPEPVVHPIRSTRHRLAWGAASIAAAMLIAAAVWFVNLDAGNPPQPIDAPTAMNLATLTDLEQAVFVDSVGPMNLGKSLTSGPIQLASGRAQLMFESTAVVDLIGPCRFVTTGPNRGRLLRGRLEAYVPAGARGFAVDLPTGARVIDLGTRFAVEVDPLGNSRAVVYEGTIQVHDGRIARTMTAGQFATITKQGVDVDELRLLPGESIDLLDMLAIDRGEPRLDAGFDPRTGAWTTTWSQQRIDLGAGSFQPAPRGLIDGVLLPGREGRTPLDSAGHTAALPPTDGLSLGPIWIRWKDSTRRESSNVAWIYAFDLDPSWFDHTAGVLGLHPNSGLCFDLAAIRQRRGAVGMTLSLQGRVADVRPIANNRQTSAFWVYVDGEPAASYPDLRQVGRRADLDVMIPADARHLTLIATDGGDSSVYDWQIVGDLRLVNSQTTPPASK